MATILKWWKNYAAIVMLLVMVIGLKYPMIMLVFFICMIGPSLTGFFTGRFWCGNICPIGIFFDNVLIKISNHQKAPKFFKSKWIRIIFTTLMMSMFSFEIFYSFGKPVMMGMVFYEMILEAVITGTFLSVIYHNRVWCHFCPMGSTGAFVTYLSNRKKVLNVSEHCSKCRKCEESCPMGLAPHEYQGTKLSSYNCIQCGVCVKSCPNERIGYQDNIKPVEKKSIDVGV